MKTKKSQSKKKISLFKLNNKRLNKLSKQGKLKKAVGKKKLVSLLKERTNENSEKWLDKEEEPIEPDIPLQEADYEYFATSDRNYSFLTGLTEDDKPKRKRKKNEEEEDEENTYEGDYERRKKKGEPDVRFLLPLKNKKALIHQYVFIENNEKEKNQDLTDEVDNNQEESDDEDELTEVEKFVNELQRKEEWKKSIKENCIHVMQDVDENISKLNQVIDHLSARRPTAVSTYAMVNLLEVYKDIIPEYKIREATQKEKAQKMKKETVKLLSTEESLLKSYRRYLQALQDFVKGKNLTSKNKNNPSLKLIKKKRHLRKEALVCMAELLVSKSHFNYRTIIVGCVVGALFHHHSQTSDVACEMLKKVFNSDKQGEVSLEIVRLIGRGIKEKKYDVKAKVLDTFLSLRIKHAVKDGEEEDEEEKRKRQEIERKKSKAMSRKEKKRQKSMKHLEKELKEVAMEDDIKHRSKFQTETISVVFLIYFRILKQNQSSTLLSSVLEGLAKFCHLINVTFFDDLFKILSNFVDSGELTQTQSLHCIKTALGLLMGQGSAFNIDPANFYTHLYKCIMNFQNLGSKEDLTTLLSCLHLMLVQRRRQVTDQRCMPFLKKLATLSLSLPPSAALPTLSIVRSILQLYPKCDVLLDMEEVGGGVYDGEIPQPDYAKAYHARLYELHLLRLSYHKDVAFYSEHILHSMPRNGSLQLSSSLSRMSSVDLYEDDFELVVKKFDKMAAKLNEKNLQNSTSLPKARLKRKNFHKSDEKKKQMKLKHNGKLD